MKARKKKTNYYVYAAVLLVGYLLFLAIAYPPQRQMTQAEQHLTMFSELEEMRLPEADRIGTLSAPDAAGLEEYQGETLRFQKHTFAVEAFVFESAEAAQRWYRDQRGLLFFDDTSDYYRDWNPLGKASFTAYLDNKVYRISGSACRDFAQLLQELCAQMTIPLS